MSLQLIGRLSALILVLLLPLLFLAGCLLPGDAAPIVKFGVIAPFEGAGRPLGYAILPAIKSVVAEANAHGELAGFRVAVVALDDSLDPAMAAQQARALSLDPDVIAVIGPFTEGAAAAVEPVLAASGTPHVPVITARTAGADYSEEVAAAKEAANALLQALAADIAGDGRPSRSGLSAELVSP